MSIYSKFAILNATCEEYAHSFTKSCSESHSVLLIAAIQESFRIYVTVYTLALFMRGRLPKMVDFKRTFIGIIQSTAFLSMCAFSYSFFVCTIRNFLGHFNFLTVSFLPSFLSSICSILIERPSRRNLLSLYVANVATETLWRMAVARKLVTPIKNGEVIIFGFSIAVLLFYFRNGQHKTEDNKNDSLFDLLRFVVGPYEEKGFTEKQSKVHIEHPSETFYQEAQNIDLRSEQVFKEHLPSASTIHRRRSIPSKNKNALQLAIIQALRVYKRIINKIKCTDRHISCPHPFSCVYYVLSGGMKQFTVGFSLQLILKLLLNIKRIIKRPKMINSIVFNKKIISLGLFLGGFSSIYRLISCILRWFSGRDSAFFAIPASLIASLSFSQYPDNTVALYVMWKMLQRTYQLAVRCGYVSDLPGFTIFLYSFSTAILFHVAIFEPTNLRPSYWKFLHSVSGGRIAAMDRTLLEMFGLNSNQLFLDVTKKIR